MNTTNPVDQAEKCSEFRRLKATPFEPRNTYDLIDANKTGGKPDRDPAVFPSYPCSKGHGGFSYT